ncbi:histidine kinase sensor domain-containing protein [Vibrio europaeus]|uniref:histidine kinase n=1 Tax=Vibrio europaeus TaxID=300876 RepID=A0A178JF05_9VIBR|nr:histidine kinase sensor domain-containing protein [Vibrio europaeus]MDC5707333.1 histidine kinase sensor domain-containing protein [Vibrio europaeus]MDC5712698.1 histidine kinase sensor domain-containing protein [Vibrio europaeus]MDC5717341.1 histidine kinase sensor domain-containing protein [Vibrio europaeus]MDC5721125.1 histidine kinase sensor domain-containing protein [Vibrio europaeus]MDC5726641.1 histidine kinase sensor domain-containing protein [Vibrio europaeus]
MVWSWRVKSLSKRKDSLVFQLFSYMSTVIISIVILQAVAEQALIKTMLKVPLEVKQDIQSLAHQANVLIEDGDMDELADWANAQPYYLFVLNPENKPLSHRQMHPHFEFKLRFLREIDELLEDRVNKPLIGVRLDKGNTLVVQLPSQLHPAHRFIIFFAVSKFIIVIAILLLFSLIFARKLQMPLDRLREASRRLASGDFKVKVVKELRSNTREFNDLAHDFDNMTKEIHALAERQRRLIRDVSHELRTPLARQNLALHLLRSKAADSELPLVERLEKEVDEMDSLVGEILEFSRLENSRYEADSTPVCLESLISTQIEQSRLQLKAGQSLSISTGSMIPVVMTDERLVVRCITNLLSNSMKYAGENAHIEVSIYELDDQPDKSVCIEVADNGPGIAQAQLEEIFRPFTRLESARDKQSGGYGLGLAIVKEAMKLLGGEVKASNRKESGLRVQLILPI